MSADEAPNLTSSDSDQSSGSEFSESDREGTSDYGSKSQNEDDSDLSLTLSDCPPLEEIIPQHEADKLTLICLFIVLLSIKVSN